MAEFPSRGQKPYGQMVKTYIDESILESEAEASATYAPVATTLGTKKTITPAALNPYIHARGSFGPIQTFLKAGFGHAGLQSISDSTGGLTNTDTDNWIYQFAQKCAADNPALTVRYRAWESGATPTKYVNSIVVQEGTAGRPSLTFQNANYSYARPYIGQDAATPTSGPFVPPTITGDFDISVKFKITTAALAANGVLVSRSASGSPDLGWNLYLRTDNTLLMQWSNDGGTSNVSAASTAAVPVVANTPIWVRMTMDVDNGSGQSVVTFYYRTADGAAWTQLGTAVTSAFVATVNQPAAYDYALGATNANGAGGISHFVGDIYECWIRQGIDGPTVLPTQAISWVCNTLNRTAVTQNPGFMLDVVNGAWAGKGLSDFNTEYQRMLPHLGQILTVLTNGGNGGSWDGWNGEPHYTRLDTFKTNLYGRLLHTAMAVCTELPKIAPAPNVTGTGLRWLEYSAWAARNGLTLLDVRELFRTDPRWTGDNTSALMHSDAQGVHPSRAGSTLIRELVSRAIATGA